MQGITALVDLLEIRKGTEVLAVGAIDRIASEFAIGNPDKQLTVGGPDPRRKVMV
jgi:hypothetical protein